MSLRTLFENKYYESLKYFRYFYDDLNEYGNPEQADEAFYFIYGFDGSPGQIRFAIPSLYQKFQHRFYIRSLSLPEFSASTPIWEKYSPENQNKRESKINEDLCDLAKKFEKVSIVASSTGFYDFLPVYPQLSKEIQKSLQLFWVASAPDYAENSAWEKLFFPLNGFEKNEFRWFALPNSNLLTFINPEASLTYNWKFGAQNRILFKHDLESRFKVFGFSWTYLSSDCMNWLLNHCTENITAPIDIKAYVLSATKDGYWQGQSIPEMKQVINKYITPQSMIWKDNSHLWVNTPENISELLSLAT